MNTPNPDTNTAPSASPEQAVPFPKLAMPDTKPNQSIHETNMEVCLPGTTAQVYVQFVTGATLDGMVIEEGGELQKIIAGNVNITAQSDGAWVFGQQIPPGVYCIAILKNVSKETKALKGAFIVSPPGGAANGPVPGSLTSPHASAVAAVSMPAMPGGFGASTSPRAPAGGSPTVTPGSNEIAVLLPYGEAKRLLNIVNGAQQPLSESERAGVARAFHDAFQRSGMG